MVAITRLSPAEAIDVDCSIVAALFYAHGPLKAEDLLMDHVADLTDRIVYLDEAVQNHGLDRTLVRASAELQDLALLADSIGLTSLANALQATAEAARADNRIALPALWERVKRIGDQSLVLLWDIPQLRM